MDRRILDIKPEGELNKHRSNFNRSGLVIRKGHELNVSRNKEFTIDNIINTNEAYFVVNIEKFSGFAGHYYFNKSNALVNTSLQLLKNINLKLEDSYLFNHYNNFQPKTCGDLYRLHKNNKLHTIESTNSFHPWRQANPTGTFSGGIFGPKDITAVEHRILRLKNLINNIKEFGYIPSPKDIIEGYILLKNDDFRFVITAGHHRVAVLTAMYITNILDDKLISVKYDTSRIKVKIVKENDVQSWFGVKSGFLTAKDALEMFGSYFE